MTDENETVEIDRETLSELRHFADRCSAEHGGIEVFNAILDAGLALDLYDPTPSTPPTRMDIEGLRTWNKYTDEEIENYLERYAEHHVPE